MNKNYPAFSVNDFLLDEYFIQWVYAPTQESNKFWTGFITQNPNKEMEVAEAVSFLKNLHFANEEPGMMEIEASLKKNLANLDLLDNRKKNSRVIGFRNIPFFRIAIAACFIGLVAFTLFRMLAYKPLEVQVITGANEKKNIYLPDSSFVVLNSNSTLTYSTDLGTAELREVWLEGEGFFNVTKTKNHDKDAKRFIVHCSDLNVEVIGTSFNIRKKESLTNVTLNTGKIRISVNKDPAASVELQPGDFMQYSSGAGKIIKKKVQPELYSVWKEERYVMDHMPLKQIAQFIEDTYNYNVIISDPELEKSELSGTLRTADENTLISTIEFALDLKIVRKNNEIIIQQKYKTK